MIAAESTSDDEAYALAAAILDSAEDLASAAPARQEGDGGLAPGQVVAVVVWDGASRGPSDLTEQFRQDALSRKFEVREVLTLPNG